MNYTGTLKEGSRFTDQLDGNGRKLLVHNGYHNER
jgi:hypothetical protein